MTKLAKNVSFNLNCNAQPLELFNSIVREIKNNSPFSSSLKNKIETFSREFRRDVVRRDRGEGCPIFIAAKIGNVDAIEYLYTICDADLEQTGIFEVTEEKTIHTATPLWVACVCGNLAAVKCLVRLGSNINAQSDSGSTSVRSACFMTNVDVVKFLITNGANLNLANYNGGTCLINSVQSIKLCKHLISKGVDINATDIQNKTALHYAIQEHRLEATQLLLNHGANPYIKSRYGDDALQTACLKGTYQIFDYLRLNVNYTTERIVNAYELLGSTLIDENQTINDANLALNYWRYALDIRLETNMPKPEIEPRPAYGNVIEFQTIDELNTISIDIEQMRIQSLLISERILGLQHKDMMFRLLFRGAKYADNLCFEKCLYLWILLLDTRIIKNTILHSDAGYVAQAIVRLMLNLTHREANYEELDLYIPSILKFNDIYNVFNMLTSDICAAREMLSIRPIYKKQQENFDKMLKCVTHLIYMLMLKATTEEEWHKLHKGVYELIRNDIRSITNDTLLHLCVSRLNSVKPSYFLEEENQIQNRGIFPNKNVVSLLLHCGIDVNARNDCRSTALYIATIPYNYDVNLIELLLRHGAHLDQPNKTGDTPLHLITINPLFNIPIVEYSSLKCLAASVIVKYRIPYQHLIPITLEQFVHLHET